MTSVTGACDLYHTERTFEQIMLTLVHAAHSTVMTPVIMGWSVQK